MKKSVSITIHSQVFHLEEEAYKELQNYLQAVHNYFKKQEDGEEIINDIENSIAEHFSEILSPAKNVITQKDVEILMQNMGKVEDFQNFDAEDSIQKSAEKIPPTSAKGPKKLFRDPENKIIAGVASGLANYFGIDPIITRLIFAIPPLFNLIISFIFYSESIFGFFSLLSIGTYFLLWFIVPKAKTTAEKMEMQGKSLNLTSLAEQVQQEERQKKSPKSFVRLFFDFIGEVIKNGIQLIKKIALFLLKAGGLMIILGGIAFAIILTLQFFFILFIGLFKVKTDIPILEIITERSAYILLVAGYIGILIPIIFMMVIGKSLLKFKNTFKVATTVALLGVWILSITAGMATFLRELPEIQQKIQTHMEWKDYNFKDFSELEFNGHLNATIHQGNEFKIRVQKGYGNKISIEQKDGRLIITEIPQKWDFCFVCENPPTSLDVTLPDLKSLKAAGHTHVDVEEFFSKTLNLETSGHAAVGFRNGGVETLNAKMMDSTGTFMQKNFQISHAFIQTSGRAFVYLNTEKIDAQLSENSQILYEGEAVLNVQKQDSASILSAEEYQKQYSRDEYKYIDWNYMNR